MLRGVSFFGNRGSQIETFEGEGGEQGGKGRGGEVNLRVTLGKTSWLPGNRPALVCDDDVM